MLTAGVWSLVGNTSCAMNTEPQAEQYQPGVRPVLVQVGRTIAWTTIVWLLGEKTVSCATNTASHTEQCDPSVLPSSAQVIGMAGSVTTVCPVDDKVSCATNTTSHSEQCLPSVRPVLVQVGATAVSTTSAWTGLPEVLPQIQEAPFVQSAGMVKEQGSGSSPLAPPQVVLSIQLGLWQ